MLSMAALLGAASFCEAAPREFAPLTNADFFTGKALYESVPFLGPVAHFYKKKIGLSIEGMYRGYFYGNVAGGKNTGASWDQEIRLTGTYDFSFLSENLRGFTLTGGFRWRYGRDPNNFVGATIPFQPSTVEGGKYYRLRPFYLTYVTPELLGVKNLLILSAGWQNPYDLFLQQPLSKLFSNFSIYTSKGLGANIPWSSSYAGWGGYSKIATRSVYAQVGLYMAIPEATAAHNHGLFFQGSQMPGKPNGLYAIGETGWTPLLGPSGLRGKYVFGGYWFGAPGLGSYLVGAANTQGHVASARYGFYWQVDQQLYCPPSERVRVTERSGNEYDLPSSGLYSFNMCTFAPSYNNVLTFYFQTGLVYQGVTRARIRDSVAIAYGNGTYSKQFASMQQYPPTSQAVLEINYDMSITKWLNFRPYYQLLINPSANNTVKNASILGFTVFAAF